MTASSGAVSGLLSLLSEVKAQRDDCCPAERLSGDEELGDPTYHLGARLKQRLLADRKARLCRFLELASAGSQPRTSCGGGSSHGGSAARRRLARRSDSAEEPGGLFMSGKPSWSPVSILEGAGPGSEACSTPCSSRSVDFERAPASLKLTPVPFALHGNPEEQQQAASASSGPKPPPPPPPMPPPPSVLRLGVRVMPPTPLDITLPMISPRARVAQPATPTQQQQQEKQRQQQHGRPAGAPAPPPPPPPLPASRRAAAAPPPPPPPLPKAAGRPANGPAPPPPPPPPPPKVGANAAPPPPPPPPPPGGRPGLPRLAVPGASQARAAGASPAPPPPPCQPGALPAHLLAPPPKEGVQRRPIHFDSVKARAAQGSLWEEPPEQEAADPAQAVRVGALDRLFARHTLPAASEAGGSEAGTPPASPQRAGTPCRRSSSGKVEAGGPEAASCGDDGGDGACVSPGRLASRGSLGLGARRPVIRIFTGGRKAVNIEILLRQLGSPADVAQAVAELDTRRLQVPVLRELQANMPDASELEALHTYLDTGGDPAQLGRAEQMFVALRGTARLEQKLQVLQFKGGLQEQAGEVLEPLSRILAALHQLRASPALRALLHTALRLGNALNAGRKAPARGIRLAHLRKLADTRSMDGATTLLHYLAALAREACPAALTLGKPGGQCSAVPEARHWSFAELESAVGRVAAGADMVRREQRAAGGGEARQLGVLAGQAAALVQRAGQLLAAARERTAEALRYLGDDVAAEPGFSSAEPRRMLGDVGDFLLLLHRANADAERMAVCLETLRQQREEEAAAAAAERGSCDDGTATDDAAAAAAGAEQAKE